MIDLQEEEAVGIDTFLNERAYFRPVVTAQNLCSINSCPDQQMYRARIQFLFQLEAYCQDEQGNVDQRALQALIDMVHDAILFSTDNSLSYAKSIVFLTIFVGMIEQTIAEHFYNPNKIYKIFKHYLLVHSIDRPPYSVAIFDLSDVKLINDYFIRNFFRNLKLIVNCLTPKPTLGFRTNFPIHIDVPIIPPLIEMEIENQNPPESAKEKEQQEKEIEKPTSGRQEKSARGEDKSRGLEKDKSVSQVPPVPALDESKIPEEPSPDVPLDVLRDSIEGLHEKFVHDFEDKERQIIGKIKELEIRMAEKVVAINKKTPVKSGRK